MEHRKAHRSYANKREKETGVDVEIPLKLRCSNAIHMHLDGAIPWIHMASIKKRPLRLHQTVMLVQILQFCKTTKWALLFYYLPPKM
jgi:hypothetical protein